jgi:hypothetical protein
LKSSGSRCLTEQRHLVRGSAEREYWHWGYLVALSDILRALPHRAGKSAQ